MKEVKVKSGNITTTIKNIFAEYKICAPESIPMYDYWVENSTGGYHVVYTVGSDGYLREEVTTQKSPMEYYAEFI